MNFFSDLELLEKVPMFFQCIYNVNTMFLQCFFDKFIWKSMKKSVEKHRKNIGKTLIKTRPM